jgi:hypothetical protein
MSTSPEINLAPVDVIIVTPAKAGVQGSRRTLRPWVPAFAGMTEKGLEDPDEQ